MKKIFKVLLWAILALFILIQLYPRPKKNIEQSSFNHNDISVTNKTPLGVQNILKTSCYDCHSNNTIYPWYSYIQPVASWLGNHVFDGKKQMNFSEFGTYSVRKKYKKLEETISEVKEGQMPLKSYTLIHTVAKLDPEKKALLIDWVNGELERMRAFYPADSLIRKKK